MNIRIIKLRYISAPGSWPQRIQLFYFSTYSVFIFDEFWGSLGTSIFGNSSSTVNNTWSRLPSRLSFCFFWLWYFHDIYKHSGQNQANKRSSVLKLKHSFRNTCSSQKNLSYMTPIVWNSLPTELKLPN